VNRTKLILTAGGVAVSLAVAWLLFIALPRWAGQGPGDEAETVEESAGVVPGASEPGAEAATRRIGVRLFYVTEDGRALAPRDREIEYGEDTAQQARRILEAQLTPPPPPLVSAIPEGTTLKELFLGGRGEAYVDLSQEVSGNHPGGSLDELLTVYTIVHALTENLPAISVVQILIDGREVDTLTGHVDLRRPLPPGPEWLQQPAADGN